MTITKMDRYEALVQASQIAVCIFADEALTDFSLVNARDFKLDPQFPRFLGVAGIVDMRPATALHEALEPSVIQTLASAFTSYVAGRIVSVKEQLPGTN